MGTLSTELKPVSVAALTEKHADFAKGCDKMAAFATETMQAVGAALADAEKERKAAGGQGDDVTALNLRTTDKVLKDVAFGEKVLLGEATKALAAVAAKGQKATTEPVFRQAFGESTFVAGWLESRIRAVKTDVRTLMAELDKAAQDDADFAKGVKTKLAVDALNLSVADWGRLKEAVEKVDKSVLAIAAKALGKEIASKAYIEATETPVPIKAPKATGVALKLKKNT